MLSLSVCIVGCSQAEDSDNQSAQAYSEEYEISSYGNDEELDTPSKNNETDCIIKPDERLSLKIDVK